MTVLILIAAGLIYLGGAYWQLRRAMKFGYTDENSMYRDLFSEELDILPIFVSSILWPLVLVCVVISSMAEWLSKSVKNEIEKERQ